MDYKAVIGHEKLKEKLRDSVANNRISHAQLFLGPEGSGNLALALAYASHIIIENAPDKGKAQKKCDKLIHPDMHFSYPVNTTASVKKEPRSAHFSAEWREAVSANPYLNLHTWLSDLGIENKQGIINVGQAGEIRQALSLKSMESKYKVTVIWMPENLHEKAANKLLKLLEEPTDNTVFLLVAEQTDQILTTILSRTQIVQVPALTPVEMRAALIEREKCSPDQADTITALSEGNYFRALQHLKQDGEADSTSAVFQEWMRTLWKKDIYAVLKFVDEMSRAGRVHQKHFLAYGLHIFRECLALNYGSEKLLRSAGNERNFIEKFSKMVHSGNAVDFAHEFEKAAYHIERNVNGKLIFTDLSLKCMKLLRKKARVE